MFQTNSTYTNRKMDSAHLVAMTNPVVKVLDVWNGSSKKKRILAGGFENQRLLDAVCCAVQFPT